MAANEGLKLRYNHFLNVIIRRHSKVLQNFKLLNFVNHEYNDLLIIFKLLGFHLFIAKNVCVNAVIH